MTFAAYEAFAAFYDRFTADHDFETWTLDLERVALGHGARKGRLLDVGCGTGKSLAPMQKRGWECVGVDLSPAMLDEARERVEPGTRLEQHDVRSLPRLGEFDVVWSLGDLVNYLQPDELEPAFARLRANLRPGGVLLFDAASGSTFRTVYSRLSVYPREREVIVIDGRGWVETDLAEVRLERLARADDGAWTRERSLHRHRYHGREALVAALARCGFDDVRILDNGADGSIRSAPARDEGVKLLALARRTPS